MNDSRTSVGSNNDDNQNISRNIATGSNSKNNNNNNNNNNEFICGVVEGFYGKPWTFNQRKDLFKRLRELNLNAFMYAPKDDTKHRAKWRQLYNDAEAHELKILIDEAAANGIDFYYSLAPGLDMVYSAEEDSRQLCKKFDQLKSLGCKSFAILFDDIEPSLTHERDRLLFKNNYASAQVSVTNLIYNYLEKPKFLFCPTEYCGSRAVPNVPNSLYLNTIGTGLHNGIDIMWSGCRVISRCITEESIKQLNSVIRRPAVIWENLHANDYDKKRVYLGPYSGRSTKIIPQLRGVLTNPNCEYEANYIAIHTLAQWSKCTNDANPHNKCNINQTPSSATTATSTTITTTTSNSNQVTNDLDSNKANSLNSPSDRMATQAQSQHQQAQNLDGGARQADSPDDGVYDPDRALARALRDWLPHVLSARSLPQGINVNMSHQRNDDPASDQISKEEDACQEVDMPDSHSPAGGSTNSKNDVEMSGASPGPPTSQTNIDPNSCDSCEMQADPPAIQCMACTAPTEQAPHEILKPKVDMDSLALLVDFFYLPFEHGFRGHAFLNDIRWLIDNSHVLLAINDENIQQEKEGKMKEADEDGHYVTNSQRMLAEAWLQRADRMSNLCVCINRIIDTMVHDCPNKLLMAELYPYMAELRAVIIMLGDYIEYLRYRKQSSERFYYCEGPKRREFAPCDEQEPWVHRGGLIGDVQRLIAS